MNFEVMEQELADEILAGARIRGAYDTFLTELETHYTEWAADAKNAEKTFSVDVRKHFPTKNLPSLNTALQQRITKLELKQDWRLIKRTLNNTEYLIIAHL